MFGAEDLFSHIFGGGGGPGGGLFGGLFGDRFGGAGRRRARGEDTIYPLR